MIDDPEIQSTVLSMIVAQNLLEPNDPALLKLQGEVSETKKESTCPRNGVGRKV